MKRISLLIFTILYCSTTYADEKLCWTTFDYGGEQTSGPGGQGGSMSTTADPFVYKRCKSQCYENLPSYENIKGIKSCTIDGIDIEQSNYKRIYLTKKANI